MLQIVVTGGLLAILTLSTTSQALIKLSGAAKSEHESRRHLTAIANHYTYSSPSRSQKTDSGSPAVRRLSNSETVSTDETSPTSTVANINNSNTLEWTDPHTKDILNWTNFTDALDTSEYTTVSTNSGESDESDGSDSADDIVPPTGGSGNDPKTPTSKGGSDKDSFEFTTGTWIVIISVGSLCLCLMLVATFGKRYQWYLQTRQEASRRDSRTRTAELVPATSDTFAKKGARAEASDDTVPAANLPWINETDLVEQKVEAVVSPSKDEIDNPSFPDQLDPNAETKVNSDYDDEDIRKANNLNIEHSGKISDTPGPDDIV